MNKKTLVSILGIIISILLLFWLFKNINWVEFKNALSQAQYLIVVLGMLVHFSGFYFRTLRWRELMLPNLNVSDESKESVPNDLSQNATSNDENLNASSNATSNITTRKKATMYNVFAPLAMGYATNNILPLRIGDILRGAFAGVRLNASKAMLFSTVIIERVIDVVTLFVLLCLVMIFHQVLSWAYTSILAACLVVGLIVLVLIAKNKKLIEKIVPKFARNFIDNIVDGFNCIKSMPQLAKVIGYSFCIWFIEFLTVLIISYAFGMQYQLLMSLLIVVLINLVIIIPAAPGNFGTLEAAAQQGFIMFGAEPSHAMAMSLVLHMVQYIPITITGFVIIAKEGININDKTKLQD
ncbi:MAG: flippase-like domain-containing protein [Clostridiales bacterium]|jgi:uncharacterized protein (TIRG00374 family)|nr:flippase-like domain-containing protein [Clostridiales bacterium]